MTRKIKIVTLNGISGTIETNVTTLAELKPLLSARSIDYSGMKLLVGETKNELSEDVAILPQGDFKLYLTPAKTKSGSIESTLEEIQEDVEAIDLRLELISESFEALKDKVEEILALLCNKSVNNITPNVTQNLSFEDLEDIRDINQLADDLRW